MSAYVLHPGTLYNYTAGVYCGVMTTEPVMRKLAALQAKHLEDVKRLLTDEAIRGNVFPSMWTLYYPDGEQTHVQYIATDADVHERIKSATTSNPPVVHRLVFIASSMDEAKAMAEARHKLLKAEQA